MDALSEEQIRRIEEAIGLPLPEDVRIQYRMSNGLEGPTGCHLLSPCKPGDSIDIVHANTLRQEEWFPASFKSVILIGDDGVGNLIGYDWDTNEAILWNPVDGNWIQERKNSIAEMWSHIREWYERVAPE